MKVRTKHLTAFIAISLNSLTPTDDSSDVPWRDIESFGEIISLKTFASSEKEATWSVAQLIAGHL